MARVAYPLSYNHQQQSQMSYKMQELLQLIHHSWKGSPSNSLRLSQLSHSNSSRMLVSLICGSCQTVSRMRNHRVRHKVCSNNNRISSLLISNQAWLAAPPKCQQLSLSRTC